MTRSNSFNFEPVLDVPRSARGACPLRSGDAPLARVEPLRDVFVRLRDRMRLYRTATTDFSPRELADTKCELGQLYVDVSTKLAPDDFSADLRKLELDAECGDCELRERCPGCFHAVSVDVFQRDDARVRELLGALEGDVLDVGCGEGPYLDALTPRAMTGKVRYLGLDPDAGRIAVLRSRYPWADYQVGELDALGEAPARFDHALILRSYNHLPDPDATLRSVITKLRVGGTLLVVDNVAFGLVRTRAQVARAEASSARFEHFRNDSTREVDALLARAPLALLERREIAPSTSNQWLLHYQRLPETRE